MLTAISSSKQQVIAWETSRSDGPFCCPECGYPVILKAGQKKIHHFAHAPGAECEFGSGETEEHIRIKRELYETLLKAPGCKNWAMERYIYEGVVRPDLSGRINDIPLVIEVQRSNTTVETVIKRFQEYSRHRIPMLWVLTKAPSLGSSSLADWKIYLQLIYQGVLYIHKADSQVSIMKCDYNSWSVRTYDTKVIGIADIVKDFSPFEVEPFSKDEMIFDGGWIWTAKQVGEMLLDEVVENIKAQRSEIIDLVKRGDVEKCNNNIDALKEYISTIQLPNYQSQQLKEFLTSFDAKCELYRSEVAINAEVNVRREAQRKAEREEWERQAAIKWEEERPEREARYKRLAEQAAAEWHAAQEARKLWVELPLTDLEIQEKAERELWRAEKARQRREIGRKTQSPPTQLSYDTPYDKESWKIRLAAQNASAEAWEKKKAEQANNSSGDNKHSSQEKGEDESREHGDDQAEDEADD